MARGRTALLVALQALEKGRLDTVRALLAVAGVDPNVTDKDSGRTALLVALDNDHPDVVRAVTDQIARLNTNTRYVVGIVDAYIEALKARLPQALLILVPRHPERFARVAGLVERDGDSIYNTYVCMTPDGAQPH